MVSSLGDRQGSRHHKGFVCWLEEDEEQERGQGERNEVGHWEVQGQTLNGEQWIAVCMADGASWSYSLVTQLGKGGVERKKHKVMAISEHLHVA